jgi:hypothetical protein
MQSTVTSARPDQSPADAIGDNFSAESTGLDRVARPLRELASGNDTVIDFAGENLGRHEARQALRYISDRYSPDSGAQ